MIEEIIDAIANALSFGTNKSKDPKITKLNAALTIIFTLVFGFIVIAAIYNNVSK